MDLLLAKKYEAEKHDPTGWWISEKLDGVRAYYRDGKLYTRTGHVIATPNWFLGANLIPYQLDGELWTGRGGFQDVVSIVRKKIPVDEEWKSITFQIFDIPDLQEIYEVRMKTLKNFITHSQSLHHFDYVKQWKCESKSHLMGELIRVENLNGEGLMLRQPESSYEWKRSGTLLKVKSTMSDEVEIIGYEGGKGKYVGMVGSLVVKNSSGIQFKIGTGLNDVDRKRPPPIGSMVTMQYTELTRDKIPRFPVFICARDYE